MLITSTCTLYMSVIINLVYVCYELLLIGNILVTVLCNISMSQTRI